MEIVEVLKSLLKEEDSVLFGYLFGSYATGNYSKSSDVDIALYLKEDSLDERLELIYRLSKALKKDIDLLVLNDAKNIYLLDDVLQNGILVKDGSERVDFELKKEHEILDFKAFRSFIDAM